MRQRHQNPGHVVNSWLDHKKMLSYLPNILANPSSKSVKLQYSKDLREMDSFQFLYSQNCVILHEIAFKLDLTFDQIFYRDYGARDFNSLRFTWTDLPFSDNFPGRNFCMFAQYNSDVKKVRLVVRRKSQCFMQCFIFQINYYFQLGYKINIYSTFLVSC